MHLDYATLSAVADGDLNSATLEAANAHLRACAKCREELQFIRTLGDGLRALQTPSAPRDVFEEIWPENRETPPASEPRTRRWTQRRGWPLAFAAGAAGLLATAFVLTFGADRAMAGSSTLELERADSGALTLRYTTISPLAADASVRARVRYWIPDSLRFAQNEGGFGEIELYRETPGRFEGVIDLPPGTVYAAATVEDVEGTYVDSDFGRFWEYLETDVHGRPTLQARRYQVQAALEFNVRRAESLVQQATSEFPDQPVFWFWRRSFELAAFPEGSNGMLRSAHVARLGEFDRAARAGIPGPLEIYALYRYAQILERPRLTDYWRSELLRRYPRHGAAALVNLEVVSRSGASTNEKLDALEEDWERIQAPATARLGLRYSYELAEPMLTRTWLDRHESSSWSRSLRSDTEVARRLMEVPALRPLAERWISGRLSFSHDWVGSARRLDQSRYNFEVETRQSQAHLFLYLARIRLEGGDVAGGVDALERSVAATWDPRLFVRAAEIHRSLGSDARATELISLAQVDPVASVEPYLSTEDALARVSPTDAELALARTAMQKRISAGLMDEYVNLEAGLQTKTGGETTLKQAASADGGVTLVVYAIQPDLVTDQAFALLGRNSERLSSVGVRTVFVSERADNSSNEDTRAEFQFYYDPAHEVWAQLRAWRSVQYFVLDRRGRLRHRGEDLASALRISLVLAS